MKLGKSVRELRASMSQAEFLRWGMYYQRIAQQMELEKLRAKG